MLYTGEPHLDLLKSLSSTFEIELSPDLLPKINMVEKAHSPKLAELLDQGFNLDLLESTTTYLGYPSEIYVALCEFIGKLKRTQEIEFLLSQQLAYMFFLDDKAFKARGEWMPLYEAVYRKYPLFYLWALLMGVPEARLRQKALSIPEAVTQEGFSDLMVKMKEQGHQGKHWGLRHVGNGWLLLHFRNRLFKLNRLQHEMTYFQFPFFIFQNQQGETCALAESHLSVREDGNFADVDGEVHAGNIWSTFYQDNGIAYVGHPVSEGGLVEKKVRNLNKQEWQLKVSPGDPSLFVHIPSTGPLDLEGCEHSMEAAPLFFEKYFPDFKWKTWQCHSWMFDPQLRDYLGPASNVILFQKRFHLLPMPKARETILERVFPNQKFILASTIGKSSLQKAVIKHLQHGKFWRNGACYFLPSEPRWGTTF